MLQSIIGIDPSLNSLGYSYMDQEGGLVTGLVKPKKVVGPERLNYHQEQFNFLLSLKGRGCLISMEDYSIGSAGRGNNNVFKIGELGGVLRLSVWQYPHNLLLVPPKSLKLFIAGSGNAGKDEMIESVYKEYGIDFTNRDDEADAFGLMQYGAAFLSRRRPRQDHKKRGLSKGTLIPGKGL